MSLFNNRCTGFLSYVIYDIRERYVHFKRERFTEGCHIYDVKLPTDTDGRPVLTADIVADVLFEEEIFHLNHKERHIARLERDNYLRRRVRDSGKLVSIVAYRQAKSTWSKINSENKSPITQSDHTTMGGAASKAHVPEELVADNSKALEGEKQPTCVEELLESTMDEHIRRQIESIFETNPELKDLANSKEYSLKLNISNDGQVTVGSATKTVL